MTPLANRSIAPDPETQGQLPTGPTGVIHRGPGPPRSDRTAEAWTPIDRWAWAYSLPVSGIARAVAGCIAYHANNKTGLGWPGIGKIVTETGFKRTAVIAAIQELERGGHLTVTREKVDGKNKVNRYQLPPMGSPSAGPVEVGGSPPHGPGSPPDGLGGSPLDGPESVSTESVQESVSSRAREVCKACGNNWPAEYGTTCYQCPQPTAAQLRRREQREQPQEAAPPPDKAPATRPDPPPLTPERQAQLEADAVENGYHKRDDGQWTKGPQPPQAAAPPPPAETETRPPPPEDTEPGPNEQRFKADFAKWTVGKRRRTRTRRRTTA